jgi:hypothetical protein
MGPVRRPTIPLATGQGGSTTDRREPPSIVHERSASQATKSGLIARGFDLEGNQCGIFAGADCNHHELMACAGLVSHRRAVCRSG